MRRVRPLAAFTAFATRSTLAATVAATFAATGLHCAYADTRPTSPCSPPLPPESARAAPDPVPTIEVVDDDSMQRLATFCRDGRSYVLGDLGQRYSIRVINPTSARVEAVVSVDGLDAVDGHPASLRKRGYVVPAFGEVVVDGWRTSLDSVAAFRFSTVPDSYGARTGHARNVGVIAAAFFRERVRPRVVQIPLPAPPTARDRAASAAPAAPADEAAAPSSNARGSAGGASASPPSAASKAEATAPAARRGLGTEFGEAQASSVVETSFTRADTNPTWLTEVRYDDRNGLVSRGIPIPPPPPPRNIENELRDTAEPFPESRFAQPPR